jgi:REP element-mobilizing transposase RayT
MSHTHFLYHIVFGTKGRLALIAETWEAELHRYLGGIVKNHNGEPIEINGMPDHIHLLVRLEPVGDFAAFMRELKASSSKWAKREHQPKFSWQRKYAAFTVSESVSGAVRNYIQTQKRHHQKHTFESEYLGLLRLHKIDFDERYLWE